MPIATISHLDKTYPKFQSEGFAAQFAIPFALKVCKGFGMDIGCNRAEWSFPGAMLIDKEIDKKHDAMDLPNINVDYIFSSHCLEHLPDWVGALDHWSTRIRSGGVLFLYLPHPSQGYWLPWNNRKHIHSFSPWIIELYLKQRGWKNIFVSGADLNNSFIAMAEKAGTVKDYESMFNEHLSATVESEETKKWRESQKNTRMTIDLSEDMAKDLDKASKAFWADKQELI